MLTQGNCIIEVSYSTWKSWKIVSFYRKSGNTWNSQGVFCNMYLSQEKASFSVYISFSLTRVRTRFGRLWKLKYHFAGPGKFWERKDFQND